MYSNPCLVCIKASPCYALWITIRGLLGKCPINNNRSICFQFHLLSWVLLNPSGDETGISQSVSPTLKPMDQKDLRNSCLTSHWKLSWVLHGKFLGKVFIGSQDPCRYDRIWHSVCVAGYIMRYCLALSRGLFCQLHPHQKGSVVAHSCLNFHGSLATSQLS